MQWHPSTDCFSINVKPVDINNFVLSKRSLLSLAKKIFDSLGFAAPRSCYRICGRRKMIGTILFPQKLNIYFAEFYTESHLFTLFKVPRWYVTYRTSKFDFTGFCDASNRLVHDQSKVHSVVLCAKTKVAPLKNITIPRLELLDSVLLTKLLSRVSGVLNYDISYAEVFCDSTIVLAWLKGPSSSTRLSFVIESNLSIQSSYTSSGIM